MTKKMFCEIIASLRESKRMVNAIAEAIKRYNDVTGNWNPEQYGMVVSHDLTVMDLLKEIMEDQYDDIYYFCEELNFGDGYYPGAVTQDGEEIDLSTPEKLYSYLVEQKQKRRGET